MNYKQECENLRSELKQLKSQIRSKETVIRSIIKKLKVSPPYSNFANSLNRMNFDDLLILEEKIK